MSAPARALSPPGVDRATVHRSLTTAGVARVPLVAVSLAVIALPLLRPVGPGNTAPVDVLILLAIATTFVWGALAGWTFRMPYAIATAATIATGVIAALVGRYPIDALIAIAADLLVFLWSAAIVNVAHSSDRLRTVLRVWGLSATCWAGVMVIGVMTGNPLLSGILARTGSRATLTFGDPNVAASYFALSFFIVWASAFPSRRGLRVMAYALLATAVLLTGSNGGILGLGLGVLSIALVRLRFDRGLPVAIAAGGLALAVALVLTRVDLTTVVRAARATGVPLLVETVGRANDSTSERAHVFEESYSLYLDGGFLGQGPGSTKSRMEAALSSYPKEAHNDFIGSLIERGFLGFAALLALLGSLGVRLLGIVRSARWPSGSAAVARPLGLLGASVVCLLSATVYEVLHFRHVWALFGVIGALSVWETRMSGRSS